VLVGGLRQAAPDLVAFEESVVTSDYDQVRDLLGDAYHIQHQRHRSEDGVGVSLASRWPLLQTREVDLSTVTPAAAAFAAVMLHARIDAPEPFGPLWFANCKPTWQRGAEYERELQAVRSAVALEELAGDGHVVVAGDFDAVPDTASIRFWTGGVVGLRCGGAPQPDSGSWMRWGSLLSPGGSLASSAASHEDAGSPVDAVMRAPLTMEAGARRCPAPAYLRR
jgi:hypothetical protein